MAHPLNHAESSARNFGARPRTIWRSIPGSTSPKPASRISGIALFGIIRKEFSCVSASSVWQSPTAKASKFQCATSENSMCARIWGAYPLHKTGYPKSNPPDGCTVSASPIRVARHAGRFYPH